MIVSQWDHGPIIRKAKYYVDDAFFGSKIEHGGGDGSGDERPENCKENDCPEVLVEVLSIHID